MKKTYHGSCHCGGVRFECELDLAEGTSKCNCSICTKTRFWKALVKAEALRLLEGEYVLVDYQFGANAKHQPPDAPIEPLGDEQLRPTSGVSDQGYLMQSCHYQRFRESATLEARFPRTLSGNSAGKYYG